VSDRPDFRQGSIEFATPDDSRSSRVAITLVGLLVTVVLVSMSYLWWTNDVTGPDYLEDASTAALLQPLRVVPIDTDLPIGSSSPYRWLLSDGFRDAEADGAWVMASTARLVFEVESFDPPVQANLSLGPLVSDDQPERSVTVSSRAGSVTVTLTEGGEVVRVPLDGRLDQEVTITCPDLDSPKSLGLGEDVRDICVKLFNVAVLTEYRLGAETG
jgi:hypothetical protein